ncbi:MEKHLA domain-containing protein [Oxynema aestuarii]|uniref:MEKHLA domain-containing protein n=1 Tax=Oxynema aestuarii AP17 TaxID=2064643 RepID=A0A6H1TUY1_9CYAN|nr:MEKHLA domain-containing protein [Oxynema aestuarii]QIZ69957.1 MEKHLA domain-containing protein [Oxynema aestuarii AP17]
MSASISFPETDPTILRQTQLILNSFQDQLGYHLLEIEGSPDTIARSLFDAPFVVVSHGTEADPIFNYGNRQGLQLWEFSWDEFTRMPSRQCVEPSGFDERSQLLSQANQCGYITNYRGVRISRTGKRFIISDVILWNLHDETDRYCGQAATFPHWTFIDENCNE